MRCRRREFRKYVRSSCTSDRHSVQITRRIAVHFYVESYSGIGEQLIVLERIWQHAKHVLFLTLDDFTYVPVLHVTRTSYQSSPPMVCCVAMDYSITVTNDMEHVIEQ